MSRRYVLKETARYRCGWACARCRRENRERGSVWAFAPLKVNSFTGCWQDEVELSCEGAQQKARKRLFRLQERVNMRCDTSGLGVSGVCRGCGRRQYWAPSGRHALAVMLAAASGVALCALRGIPQGRAWLTLGLCAAVSALLTELGALVVIRWRLQCGPEEQRPWVEEVFPEA